MDVESLQRSGRRRGSCLDVFLVMSIIFLFVALAAVAVGGGMVVIDLRSKLQTPSPPSESSASSKQTGVTPEPTYKMQNFVYLEPGSSNLKTSTMQWVSVHYGPGKTVGSNFIFDENQSSLEPKQAGSYFIYLDLNLTCTQSCTAGLLSVRVGNKLTCEVKLPAVADSNPVSRRCWTVSQIDHEKLFTQMTVSEEGLQNWRLELNSSRLGMFLVD